MTFFDFSCSKGRAKLCENEGGKVTGPRIAVTSGDPAGIGPEIMARAANGLRERVANGEFSLLLIGARSTHQEALKHLGLDDPATKVSAAKPGADLPPIGFIDIDAARVPSRPANRRRKADG